MAAHELRTPIQPVLALAQHLLSQDSYLDVKLTQQYLDIIVRNAIRLQQLTEDILDITKIERHSLLLKIELLNINEIVSNSVKGAEGHIDNKKVKLHLHFSNDDINLVNGDRRRLAQVMNNLLNNSIKFTHEGRIDVYVNRANEKDQFIYIQIKDSGSGIDAEIFPVLFSKFATKSVTGTGLGLFISKGIIEAHGGRIWAENDIDSKGASFTFRLPIINQDSNKAIL